MATKCTEDRQKQTTKQVLKYKQEMAPKWTENGQKTVRTALVQDT